jgi:hypothetical protein
MKTDRHGNRRWAFGMMLVLLGSSPGMAAEKPGAWESIDADLLASRWEPARAAASAAIDAARAGRGEGLAEPLARLALAEAGLGREREAVWHWQVAQNLETGLFPPEQLARYGAAGSLLDRSRLRRAGEPPPGLAVEEPAAAGSKVTAARKLAGEAPALSPGSRAFAGPKWLRLQAVVGTDGVPTQPVVLAGGPPSLVYDVLEAVRGWRFEPGRKEGTPVAVFYRLEVDPPKEIPFDRLVDLQGDFADTDQLLQQGKWTLAEKAAERLWANELTAQPVRLGRVGVAFALRALTVAGLGDEDAAICLWQAGQLLEPKLLHADLAAYGGPGALLERHRYWQEDAPAARSQAKPPSPIRHDYPKLATTTAKKETIQLAGLLDPKGYVRQPVLGDSPEGSAVAAAVALETVCHWRYRPATLAGRPVAIGADLPVEFLPRLRTPQGGSGPAWSADTRPGSVESLGSARPPG